MPVQLSPNGSLRTHWCCLIRRSFHPAVRTHLHYPSLYVQLMAVFTPVVSFFLIIMDCYCYHLHLCTSLHLWTLLFCIYGLCYYYCCCTVCTALLFSYSAIFIAASVRNKLIHSFIHNYLPLTEGPKGLCSPPTAKIINQTNTSTCTAEIQIQRLRGSVFQFSL